MAPLAAKNRPVKGQRKTVTGAKPPPILGACVCGAVTVEIDFPAFWAWHDHSAGTRHAHGAAYATYIGCWRSRVRITSGQAGLTRFAHGADIRSFCARCGTPILYERGRAQRMVNLPRALFAGRTGREPRYHIAIEQAPDWAYAGEPLGPLKGFPGVVWARPKRRARTPPDAPWPDPPWPDAPPAAEPAMIADQPRNTKAQPMTKIHYHVVPHDGGWAYRLGDVYSEPFASRAAALKAATRVAHEQHIPGNTTYIQYQDESGAWHTETSLGTDRPDADVTE